MLNKVTIYVCDGCEVFALEECKCADCGKDMKPIQFVRKLLTDKVFNLAQQAYSGSDVQVTLFAQRIRDLIQSWEIDDTETPIEVENPEPQILLAKLLKALFISRVTPTVYAECLAILTAQSPNH